MIKNNHTQVPNGFIEGDMSTLSGSAVKCFIAICRKTIGWHKESDYISISQMQELTGISNTSVIKAVRALEDSGMITKERSRGMNKYTVNYEETSQGENVQSEESSQGRVKKVHSQSEEKSYTKETQPKETHIKETHNRFKIPNLEEVENYCKERGNSIDPEQFCDFYESKGWMVGKNKMKSWQASVRYWEKNQKSTPKPTPNKKRTLAEMIALSEAPNVFDQ